MVGTQCMSIADWALTLKINVATGGRHVEYVTLAALRTTLQLSFISLLLWFWSLTFVKVSVCLLLMRIKDTRTWRMGICCLIIFLFVLAVTATICQLLQCNAISDNWTIAHSGKCLSPKTILALSYTVSSKIPLDGDIPILIA
jgi:hypothetical protein